jgi:type IV pilus assembly protein PilM
MAITSGKRVGLEISNSACRIAEVSVSGGRVKVHNIGQARLPARAVVDGGVVDVTAVTGAIERCMKEGGFSIKEVHLGIAGLRAITRELDMPRVPDSELDSAVRLQALDIIPFPPEKTLLSARPLEDVVSPTGEAIRRVLLAAAHRDLVDPLIQAVEAAGLVPLSVDLSSAALVRALYDPLQPTAGPEAIVSVGSGLTMIVVHEAGVPHFVRTIAEGGDTITAAIAGALDLPVDDAESTKRNLDQAGPHIRAAAAAAAEAAASVVAEIRSSIDYYATLPGRSEVTRITVTGGGSRLAGFVERLQQQLRAPVVTGTVLGRMDTTDLGLSGEETVNRDPLFTTVLGLALPDPPGVKPVDLLPPEITMARRIHRAERIVFSVAAAIVVIFLGLGVWKYIDVRHAENNVSTLQARNAALQAEINQRGRQASAFSAMMADQNAVVPVLADEVDWPQTFNDLAATTPPGGTVTAISGQFSPPPPPTTSSTGVTTTTTPVIVPQTAAQREQVVIGTVNLSIQVAAPKGLSYFKTWFSTFSTSPRFRVVTFSSFTQPKKGNVTFTATLEVLGTIQSGRVSEFLVKR